MASNSGVLLAEISDDRKLPASPITPIMSEAMTIESELPYPLASIWTAHSITTILNRRVSLGRDIRHSDNSRLL